MIFFLFAVLLNFVRAGPEVVYTMEQLIEPEGYPVEKHIVPTDDGYNLGVYRIPHSRNETCFTPRPAVFLLHGLLDTGAAFLLNGHGKALGFLLAENGFDVWIGNSRGSTYSNLDIQEDNVTPDDFWDFSLDEVVLYDLPASLQYILDHTGEETLIYVGHSQGTAAAHALFSTQHPITKNISMAFMMSPVAYVNHVTSVFIQSLATFRTDDLLKRLGYKQFLPTNEKVHLILGPLCDGWPLCADVAAIIYGYDPANLDPSKWDTYFRYAPAGASVKLMIHWAQGVRSYFGKFRRFDYGTKCFAFWRWTRVRCNQREYGSRIPPDYKLSKIKVPLVYYYGGRDSLADIRDVYRLIVELPSGVLAEQNFYLGYSHLDFIWGKDAPDRVYYKMIKKMKEVSTDHNRPA